jgi:hypothetical protein
MKTYRWRAGEAVGDVQHRPGYLGLSWDRELAAGPLLRPLKMFPWTEYNELCCLVPNARSLAVPFSSGSRIVRYEPEEDIAFLFEQIPTIDVFRDLGPPEPSFAAGSGYVFFQAKDAPKEAVQADIVTLLAALRADLEALRAQFPEEPGSA